MKHALKFHDENLTCQLLEIGLQGPDACEQCQVTKHAKEDRTCTLMEFISGKWVPLAALLPVHGLEKRCWHRCVIASPCGIMRICLCRTSMYLSSSELSFRGLLIICRQGHKCEGEKCCRSAGVPHNCICTHLQWQNVDIQSVAGPHALRKPLCPFHKRHSIGE